MPHTTTKNKRTKRLDTRPNSKFRQKQFKKFDKLNKIEDLRVTSINSKSRKERVAVNLPKQISNEEKRIRSLRKKLNSIVELQEKQDGGEKLDAQQLEKLTSLNAVVAELEGLMKKTAQQSSNQKKLGLLQKKLRQEQQHDKNEDEDEEGEEEEGDASENDDENNEDDMIDDA